MEKPTVVNQFKPLHVLSPYFSMIWFSYHSACCAYVSQAISFSYWFGNILLRAASFILCVLCHAHLIFLNWITLEWQGLQKFLS